jgi:hypothetical protein
MAQDAVDHARIGDEGDDAHAGTACANQGVGFENILQQAYLLEKM